jgi:hypothetical protein
MTVAELIARLRALPQDLPVYLHDWSEDFAGDIDVDETGSPSEYARSMHPRVEEAQPISRRGVQREYDDSLPRRVVIG